jgi:2-methylcitrate dehydratase PrpD
MSDGFSRRTFLQASGVAVGSTMLPAAPAVAATAAAQAHAGNAPPATQLLANYVVSSQWADIPGAARQEAVRSIMNWVGCCLGGCRHATTDNALAALAEFSGPAEATVLGRSEGLDILHAALLNGITSHALDYDDTHLETIIHPAGPVAAAILSLGERLNTSGEDFMHAFILGVEAECRIGKAVYPSHYERGFHITGTAGVFGAAAAAGKLLGLTEQQMIWALGIAATQSAGLKVMFGTMCKPFHPGRAAQNGLTAALLAAKNFTSTGNALEAAEGFAFTMSDEQDFSQITEDLGRTFEVSKNTYKPFACGIVTHPIIDGCIQLRNEYNLAAEQIESVSLRVNPLVLKLTGKTTPRTGLEAKFSIYHASAVAIIRGTAGPREYTDETVRDPEVIALRDRVVAHVDEDVSEEEAFVSITLKDGRTLHRHIEHAIGSLENPMTNAALEDKFLDQAQGVLPESGLQALIGLCWQIESLDTVKVLTRAAKA